MAAVGQVAMAARPWPGPGRNTTLHHRGITRNADVAPSKPACHLFLVLSEIEFLDHTGNELKAPFAELIVTGRRQMAARADCDGPLARSYGHLDALLVGTGVGLLVDKTPETMAAV